jgi:hypothetical protein
MPLAVPLRADELVLPLMSWFARLRGAANISERNASG